MTESDHGINRPDRPQQKKFPYDYGEAVRRARVMNQAFLADKSIWSTALLPLAREIERPIVVDVNNVLVNDLRQLTPNPEASQAIDDLRQIGTVVLVSRARGNRFIQNRLAELGLWHPEMVLMTRQNYSRDTNHQVSFETVYKAETEFLELMRDATGDDFSDVDFFHSDSVFKRMGPIFKKREVPIIDNSTQATRNNPGMYGLKVRPFSQGAQPTATPAATEGVSLLEAVDKVREFYAEAA